MEDDGATTIRRRQVWAIGWAVLGRRFTVLLALSLRSTFASTSFHSARRLFRLRR